jgi:hypothetical protein
LYFGKAVTHHGRLHPTPLLPVASVSLAVSELESHHATNEDYDWYRFVTGETFS